MNAIEIQDQARRLYDAHGNRAIAEAAQKAVDLERHGNRDEAQTWRRIEKALLVIRGPHLS